MTGRGAALAAAAGSAAAAPFWPRPRGVGAAAVVDLLSGRRAVLAWPVRAVAATSVHGEVMSARRPLSDLVTEAMQDVGDLLTRLGVSPAGVPDRWAIVPGPAMGMSHEDEALRCEVPVQMPTPSVTTTTHRSAGGVTVVAS